MQLETFVLVHVTTTVKTMINGLCEIKLKPERWRFQCTQKEVKRRGAIPLTAAEHRDCKSGK